MSLISEGRQTVRYDVDGNGLVARFEPLSSSQLDSRQRALELDVELSKDHGLMTIPVRLPRHLMPEWGQQEWAEFIDGEVGFFQATIDEAVVQCLSLAIASNSGLREQVIRTASEVVIDFRGDLPNKYLPMMLGGYKVGVYRSGHNWPFWLGIQPTYDLAVKDAEKICDEAGLPRKAIVSAGKLSDFLRSGVHVQPIVSNATQRNLTSWIITAAAIVIAIGTYIFK